MSTCTDLHLDLQAPLLSQSHTLSFKKTKTTTVPYTHQVMSLLSATQLVWYATISCSLLKSTHYSFSITEESTAITRPRRFPKSVS